jgi:hypothetical protein
MGGSDGEGVPAPLPRNLHRLELIPLACLDSSAIPQDPPAGAPPAPRCAVVCANAAAGGVGSAASARKRGDEGKGRGRARTPPPCDTSMQCTPPRCAGKARQARAALTMWSNPPRRFCSTQTPGSPGLGASSSASPQCPACRGDSGLRRAGTRKGGLRREDWCR